MAFAHTSWRTASHNSLLSKEAVRIKLLLDVDDRGQKTRIEADANASNLGRTVHDLGRAADGSDLTSALCTGMGALQGTLAGLTFDA